MKQFINKYKVFLTGLLMAVLSSVYELISTNLHPSYWILGWSVSLAALTYFANNLRGQAASIFTIVLSTAIMFFQAHTEGNDLSFKEIALTVLLPLGIKVLGLFYTTPPKLRGYEHSEIIETAKQEGKEITNNKTI